MESTESPKNLSATPTASFNSHVLSYQKGAGGKSSINTVGVYEQHPRRRAWPVLRLIGLLAAILVLAFLLGKVLF